MDYKPTFNGSAGSYSPDLLLAGDFPVHADEITLISGAGSLTRGTLLGKITVGAASGAKQSGTGNGTVGAVTTGTKTKVGTYVLTCIAAATDAGTFQVVDPDGIRLPDLTVGVAYAGDHINLTVADGATDWGVGAIIHVTVAAGSGKYKKSLLAATDGSNVPTHILAEDADATSGDVVTLAYNSGEFNSDAMTFGTGHTAANTRDALRDRNIYLQTPVSA